MSCDSADDFDVGVQIRKISRTGELMEHLNYPCPVPAKDVANVNIAKTLGPQGFLRASHAVSKVDTTTAGVAPSETEVTYRHDRREPVKRETIVKLEITFWPIGMVFAAGEGIMLRVAGHDQSYPEYESLRLAEPEDVNVGKHTVYTGGGYDSCLILPRIPS